MKSWELSKPMMLAFCFSVLAFTSCGKSPHVVWRFQTGAKISHQPAISGDKLIVSSNDHNVYALELKTGKQIWKTDLGSIAFSAPLVDGKRVFAGASSGDFFALDTSNGKILWKFHTGDMIDCVPCSDPEGIYFGSYDYHFYKISREGKLLWEFKTGFNVTGSCVTYKDMVYTASWDKNVYGLRRDSGQLVWKYPTGEYAYGGPIVADDGVYYSSHVRFYGFDAITGKLRFELVTKYSQNVASYQKALFTNENGLSKRTLDGKLVKTHSLEGFPTFKPSVVPPYVIVSSTTRELLGFSMDTLEQQWKFKADGQFWSEGVEHEGIYYIGNDNGYVYALKLPA